MPFALLRAHVTMAPRLEAEAAIRDANSIALGFGAMKEDAAKAYVGSLERQAAGDDPVPPAKRPRTSPREALQRLAGAGFPVTSGREDS